MEGISISLIVQKFGGSSVQDAAHLKRVCAIIAAARRAGHDVLAVFSAQGDTTDVLLRKARELSCAPSPRELDALLATGESASVALGAISLNEMGVPAVSLTACQVPLHTDSRHGEARVLGVGTERILRELECGKVVLVAGFQGVDKENDLTTLGRGGSDLTAAVLAAELHAARCQIYTDVDGVYTTDPRICPTARRLKAVSCAHMLALAREGAQVLHDRSVEYAARFGVELEVLSCEENAVGSRVTAAADNGPVTGLTRKKAENGCAVITAVGSSLPSEEYRKKIEKVLQAESLYNGGIKSGFERLSVTVCEEDATRALCLIHDVLLNA